MHSFTHYDKASRTRLNRLLDLVGMPDTSADDILRGLSSDVRDFGNAVMVATAVNNRMDCIVTRCACDYARTDFPVYTPERFLAIIGQGENEFL